MLEGGVVVIALEHDLAAEVRTAATLMLGVVCGMTITAAHAAPARASATPCAWLPAEAQITPQAACSAVRWAMRL
jgi:hypothetical protein